MLVSAFLRLHGAQNLCRRQHQGALRYLRWLELHSQDAHPAGSAIRALSGKQHPYQHQHRYDKQERCHNLEVLALDVQRDHHAEDAHEQNADVLQHGR